MSRITATPARARSAAATLAAATLAVGLAGCRGTDGSGDTGLGGDGLRRDLDAAAASAAFAPPLRGDAPVRFVSALELGASPAPSGVAHATAPAHPRQVLASARVPHNAPTRVIVRVRYVDAPAAAEEVASTSSAEPSAPTAGGGGTFSPGTEVAAGPAPGAGTGGAGRGHGRSGWGVVGGLLGVVIRGGMIGDIDHCDPHDASARHVPSPYPGQYPRQTPGGRSPGEVIGGDYHGVIGGRSSGTLVVPVGRIVGGLTRGRGAAAF
ncbi:hypothetical protein tb265_25370 [Gemmatimonadetes bacterium T265]|nr:hypothetical protein tb265_25370 [Gemmatimonadetes bacterium T265]